MLAVIGSSLPSALRSFLLTLAVVDDLIAITIIAIFYTSDLEVVPLLLALVPLGLFAALTQRRITYWWLLLPLAFATWGLVHASGVHATVAGILLGLVVPVKPRASVPVDQHPRPRRPTSPTGSSTGCGPSRPASRCPSSHSSPRACASSTAASGSP